MDAVTAREVAPTDRSCNAAPGFRDTLQVGIEISGVTSHLTFRQMDNEAIFHRYVRERREQQIEGQRRESLPFLTRASRSRWLAADLPEGPVSMDDGRTRSRVAGRARRDERSWRQGKPATARRCGRDRVRTHESFRQPRNFLPTVARPHLGQRRHLDRVRGRICGLRRRQHLEPDPMCGSRVLGPRLRAGRVAGTAPGAAGSFCTQTLST